MQVFAIFAVNDHSRVRAGLKEFYPNHHRIVRDSAYLLATKDETTREVADKVGVGDPMGDQGVTSGIVVPVTSYWGRGDADMWEWIAVRMYSDG